MARIERIPITAATIVRTLGVIRRGIAGRAPLGTSAFREDQRLTVQILDDEVVDFPVGGRVVITTTPADFVADGTVISVGVDSESLTHRDVVVEINEVTTARSAISITTLNLTSFVTSDTAVVDRSQVVALGAQRHSTGSSAGVFEYTSPLSRLSVAAPAAVTAGDSFSIRIFNPRASHVNDSPEFIRTGLTAVLRNDSNFSPSQSTLSIDFAAGSIASLTAAEQASLIRADNGNGTTPEADTRLATLSGLTSFGPLTPGTGSETLNGNQYWWNGRGINNFTFPALNAFDFISLPNESTIFDNANLIGTVSGPETPTSTTYLVVANDNPNAWIRVSAQVDVTGSNTVRNTLRLITREIGTEQLVAPASITIYRQDGNSGAVTNYGSLSAGAGTSAAFFDADQIEIYDSASFPMTAGTASSSTSALTLNQSGFVHAIYTGDDIASHEHEISLRVQIGSGNNQTTYPLRPGAPVPRGAIIMNSEDETFDVLINNQ